VLARDMETTPDMIKGLKTVPRSHADWCCYVRSVTDRAVVVRAPYGVLAAMPKYKQLSDEEMFVRFTQAIADEANEIESRTNEVIQPVTPALKHEVTEVEATGNHVEPAEPRVNHNTTEPLIKPGKEWD